MARCLLIAAILAGCILPAPAGPIPPGEGDGLHKQGPSKSIRQEAAEVPPTGAIVAGTIANPRRDKDDTPHTDLIIETVLRQGKVKPPAKIDLHKFFEVEDPKNPPRFLVFCDFDKGKLDPYRAVPLVGGAKSVAYAKKVLALDPKKPIARLAFCFGHLEDADIEVARDAFRELALASDRDILAAAHTFSSAKLRGWLTNPKTDTGRLYLYAQLLGACGKKEFPFLRDLLAKEDERFEQATDGLLLGCIWAEPKEGWRLLYAKLSGEKTEFVLRHAAFRVARYMRETQPTETRANFVKAMRTGMRHPDMVDLPVEELRKARIWDLTDEILKLYDRKEFSWKLARAAIIRYALSCEPTKASKAFLEARRRDVKEQVEDAEELLKLDAEQR